MVVHAFPVAKLAGLFLKQISKPIANFCKNRAKSSPVFRNYVCMPPAQFYNWCEVKMKMWILNLGKPVHIPVLNEAMAIELGSTLLGEGILFIIAAAILVAEYSRSARKEEKKEREIKEEKELLSRTIQELYLASEKQATQIRELTRMIYDLDGRVLSKPWVPKKEIPLGDDSSEPPSQPPAIFKHDEEHEREMEEKPKPKKTKKLKKCKEGGSKANKEKHDEETHHNSSLLLNAIALLENDLLSSQNEEREPSLLSIAINHIYKDVYRVPLSI